MSIVSTRRANYQPGISDAKIAHNKRDKARKRKARLSIPVNEIIQELNKAKECSSDAGKFLHLSEAYRLLRIETAKYSPNSTQ